MDKDRIGGSLKQVAGSVKETAGRWLGDGKAEADGKALQAQGRRQNAIGGARDKVRDTLHLRYPRDS